MVFPPTRPQRSEGQDIGLLPLRLSSLCGAHAGTAGRREGKSSLSRTSSAVELLFWIIYTRVGLALPPLDLQTVFEVWQWLSGRRGLHAMQQLSVSTRQIGEFPRPNGDNSNQKCVARVCSIYLSLQFPCEAGATCQSVTVTGLLWDETSSSLWLTVCLKSYGVSKGTNRTSSVSQISFYEG